MYDLLFWLHDVTYHVNLYEDESLSDQYIIIIMKLFVDVYIGKCVPLI